MLSGLPNEINSFSIKRRKIEDDKEQVLGDIDNEKEAELSRKKHNTAVIENYDGPDVIVCICKENKKQCIMVKCDT